VDLAQGLDTLLAAAVVAALAPVVVALLPGPRIPQVVVLLAGGVLIGPEVLGWASRPAIDLLANVGLAGERGPGRGPGRRAGRGRAGARLRAGGPGADHHRSRHPAADPARR
jgi:hypothetical protein